MVKAPDFDSGIRRFESFFPATEFLIDPGGSAADAAVLPVLLFLGRSRSSEMAYDSLMVFTGNANPKLAAEVAKRLNISLGAPTSAAFFRR